MAIRLLLASDEFDPFMKVGGPGEPTAALARALGRHPLTVVISHRDDRELRRIVEGIDATLVTGRIDQLPEVALLVQKTHADDRHAEVAGCLEVIAGHIPRSLQMLGASAVELSPNVGILGQLGQPGAGHGLQSSVNWACVSSLVMFKDT